MLIYGQKNYQVDLSEGLQMFTTLRRMGVLSEILYFHADSHNAEGLEDVRDAYQKQFVWLAKWLK